jgi:tetratricopeptide (TPR) repeat protein
MEVLLDLLNRKSEVVRREEFTPWSGKNTNRDRHPVDNHISSLQSKLGDGLIVPVSGIGYRLAPGTAVEMRPSATASEAEVLDSVAVEHFKTHRGPEILASIANCENRIKMGQADASTYVVLALAYMNAGHDGFCQMKRGEAFSLAKGAIAHALELNSRLSSAYALRGLAHFAEYAWVNAKDDFEKALALDSKEALAHCFYGHLLACQHEDVKAVEHSSYAAELRPTDRIFVLGEPWVYTLVGRCQEAVQKALRAVSLFPSFPPIHVVLGWAYQAAEHVDDAVAEYEIALKTEFHPAALASLGNAQAVQGRITTANSTLKSLDSSPKEHNLAYVSAYNRALILAGYGSSRKAECLKALEQGFERKSVWLPYAVADPRFSSLWAEKRFIKLVEKMGLTIRQA